MKDKLILPILMLVLNAVELNAREFSSLFEVRISTQDYTNVNYGLNLAFDKLLIKLSGSSSLKFRNEINRQQINKTSYVASYTTEEIDGDGYLRVKFLEEEVIELFDANAFPIIGFNRPIISFLIYIDDGISQPEFLGIDSKDTALKIDLANLLQNLSETRGIFLDIPEFDLKDIQNLKNTLNYENPAEYFLAKGNADAVVNIELLKTGINSWSINGVFKSLVNLQQDQLILFLDDQINNYIDEVLAINFSEQDQNTFRFVVTGIDNFKEHEMFLNEVKKIFSIRTFQTTSIMRGETQMNLKLRFEPQELMRELQSSRRFTNPVYDSNTESLQVEFN